MGTKIDFNYFDSRLIERAIGLLGDYKKIYQYAVVNCMAKPNLKKTADLLEQVMTRGLGPEQLAKQLPTQPAMMNEDQFMDLSPMIEGQV